VSTTEQRGRAVLGGMASSFRVGLSLTAGERRNLLIGVAIFIAAAAIPLLLGGYALQLAISIVMYTALSTSWLLFSGPTNYIALSTAAFFGIGMYTVAGGIDDLSYPLLVAAAGVGSALIAAIVGLATLRVSGVYFVIFSLGLAELIRQIMTWLQHVLGTMSGLYVTIDRSEETYYWQLLLLTAVIYLVGWWIGRSRLGFALRIIGNDELVAVHCGINTAGAKIVLFIISGTFASIVGAVVAPRWGYVEPVVAFSPFLSFQVVIMALLGGTHRLWGPLLGVIPFVLLWELISLEFPNQTTLLLGACFLLIVYVIPNGIAGLLEGMWRDLSTGEPARGLVKRLPGGIAGRMEGIWRDLSTGEPARRLVERLPGGIAGRMEGMSRELSTGEPARGLVERLLGGIAGRMEGMWRELSSGEPARGRVKRLLGGIAGRMEGMWRDLSIGESARGRVKRLLGGVAGRMEGMWRDLSIGESARGLVKRLLGGIAGRMEGMWRGLSAGEPARGRVKRLLGGSVAIRSLLQRGKDRDA
jgi:branched-chain amino acid transport system permease protein